MFRKCESAAMTCSLVFSAGEMVAGLAMAALTTVFLPVSGAHINPALSVAAALIR